METMKKTGAVTTAYPDALEVFLCTDGSYAGGLTNHGPMATEALVSMGAERWIGPFVEAYRPRLDVVPCHDAHAPEDWRSWLHEVLPDLIPAVAAQAGHGLLRVAHAIRGIERADAAGNSTELYRREMSAAVEYWRRGGPGLPGPVRLSGHLTPEDWESTLNRLDAARRPEGLLTLTLRMAASTPAYADRVAALAPSTDSEPTLDALALSSMGFLVQNSGLAAFALLHGATVSNMSRVLLTYLDDANRMRLEASVAGFVAAAVIGFDESGGLADHEHLSDGTVDPESLADAAGATLEDHTIKFTDACLTVAQRTGSTLPFFAAKHRIGG